MKFYKYFFVFEIALVILFISIAFHYANESIQNETMTDAILAFLFALGAGWELSEALDSWKKTNAPN